MEFATDNLLARILLTVATIGYSFLTIKADFNATHATNPLWTAHARYHVVWQVLGNCGVALVALYLTWTAGSTERLYLAGALGVAVLGAFYLTAVSRPLFEGAFHDENGYPPFKGPVGTMMWDLNVTIFTILSGVLVIGILLI